MVRYQTLRMLHFPVCRYKQLYTIFSSAHLACVIELLSDAIEYRTDVVQTLGLCTLHQLVFDGSIKTISCVTLHEEYIAMNDPTALKNFGFKDKDVAPL